jgi:beta-galactosidase
LEILTEAVGRVNFGKEIHDRKGLQAPIELVAKVGDAAGIELQNWSVSALPLDAPELTALHYRPATGTANPGPAFWRGSFSLTAAGDTFLDLRSWGKGVVWVNGHCLGRFWNIGPTQTMYCPAPWMRAGRNEVVVLDLLGPGDPTLAGLAQPILAELHPERDFMPASVLKLYKP